MMKVAMPTYSEIRKGGKRHQMTEMVTKLYLRSIEQIQSKHTSLEDMRKAMVWWWENTLTEINNGNWDDADLYKMEEGINEKWGKL